MAGGIETPFCRRLPQGFGFKPFAGEAPILEVGLAVVCGLDRTQAARQVINESQDTPNCRSGRTAFCCLRLTKGSPRIRKSRWNVSRDTLYVRIVQVILVSKENVIAAIAGEY